MEPFSTAGVMCIGATTTEMSVEVPETLQIELLYLLSSTAPGWRPRGRRSTHTSLCGPPHSLQLRQEANLHVHSQDEWRKKMRQLLAL